MSDFHRLQPSMFSGTKHPLEIEQQIVDIENLLKATRIPDEGRVDVVWIQLVNIAWTWWFAEKEACRVHELMRSSMRLSMSVSSIYHMRWRDNL